MPREFLLFVQESAFGVPASPGVVWPTGSATAFYGRLDQGNSFTMRPRPVMVTVPYGGGFAGPAFRVADKMVCTGTYKTKLYSGPLSQFLLNWGGQQINTAQTFPWTTTEIAGNLASVSIYHTIQRSDGTYKSRAYRGCKVNSFTISGSEDSTIYDLSLNITGAKVEGNQFDGTADPVLDMTSANLGHPPTYTAGPPIVSDIFGPAGANYPINPYVFINSSVTAASGTGCTGTAVLGNGTTTGPVDSIASITVGGGGGSGYVLPPVVTLTGGAGGGAIFTATVSGGAVTAFVQVNGGHGYTSGAGLPTVGIAPASPAAGLYIGSQRTQFSSITFTVSNQTMTKFYANRYVQTMQFVGRTAEIHATQLYKSSPDDRTAYEGLAQNTVTFGINNGAHFINCILGNNSIISTIEDDLPLDNIYMQSITVSSQWDPTTTAGYYSGGTFSADSAMAADMILNIN